MKVSIIIPTYNVEGYIKRCLNSVINQVYKNLEIIVIDDASSDGTKNIIKKYMEKDSRIISFFQTINKGVSAARNVGLKAATGEYIMFVDSDDSLKKDAIRRMVDLAEKYNSDFIDNHRLFEYTKANGKIVKFTEKKVPKKILVMGSLKENSDVLNMSTYMTGKLIKKSLFDGLEFDEDLKCYEDIVLEHQIKTIVKNYVFMNRVVYIYYQRSNSLINALGKNHICFIDASRRIKKIYEDYDQNIIEKMEAMLVSNMFLTCLTKAVKNDDTLDNNTKLAKKFLIEIVNLFPNYNNNKKIKTMTKKCINLFINDDSKLRKTIKISKNINFVNLYFYYLSIINKYEIK